MHLVMLVVIVVGISIVPVAAHAQSFDPGARVECNWKGRGKFFKGKVRTRSGDRLSIDYDDGDKEDTTAARCRALATPGFAVGVRVECNWKGRGTFFRGRVRSRSGDRLSVDYDDGDKEDTTVARCRAAGRAPTPVPPAPTPTPTPRTPTKTPRTPTPSPGSSASFAVGARVECNWKGRGKFFAGKVRTASGDRLSIDYDDGDKEETTAPRCRLRTGTAPTSATLTPSAPPNPAPTVTAPTSATRPPPSAPLNPPPTGTAKSVTTLFDEARRRLSPRRGSELLHDSSLVGTWARMEVARAGNQIEGLSVFTADFARDGTGTLTQELVALDARDQLAVVPARTIRLALNWGVSVITSDGKSATALIVEVSGSTTILAYVRQGTSLGTVPVDQATGRILGSLQLFSPVATWQTSFTQGAEVLRVALVGARDLREQLEINSLMQRTMRLGNDNLLMLRTMNSGFGGQFIF